LEGKEDEKRTQNGCDVGYKLVLGPLHFRRESLGKQKQKKRRKREKMIFSNSFIYLALAKALNLKYITPDLIFFFFQIRTSLYLYKIIHWP
jgi:hypothetical protein